LLPLVYLASLTLVVLSSAALALLGWQHVTAASIRATFSADQSAVSEFVRTNLTDAEVAGESMSATRQTRLVPALTELAAAHGFSEISIVAPTGAVIVTTGSTAGSVSGQTWIAIRNGSASVSLESASDGRPSGAGQLLSEAVPITQGDAVRLVFQIHRDASPILADAGAAWRDVLLVAGSAAVVLAGLLFVIFRAADLRLRRQQDALVDAKRRDPLTGLLNHGVAVEILANQLELA
jgi:hypothetical protein